MLRSFLCWFCFPLLLLGCYSERFRQSIPLEQLQKDSPLYYQFVAQQYYNLGSYRKSIFVYQKFIERYSAAPKQRSALAWAEYEVGFCYLLLKDYEKARFYFQSVLNNYDNIAASTLAQARLLELERLR